LRHPHFLQDLAVGPVGPLHGRLAARLGVPVVVVVKRAQHRLRLPGSAHF
jgi:threonine dehydrogenase-like Zn-dependent dehydrogenase